MSIYLKDENKIDSVCDIIVNNLPDSSVNIINGWYTSIDIDHANYKVIIVDFSGNSYVVVKDLDGDDLFRFEHKDLYLQVERYLDGKEYLGMEREVDKFIEENTGDKK